MSSSTVSIVADTDRQTGSRPAGRIRAEGKVPAVVYGHGTDPQPVAVDHRELDLAFHTDAGRNVIFELEIDGKKKTAVAHVVDRHPTKNRIVHVDFLLVDLDEVVAVELPIRIEGEGPGVKAGGVIELIRPSVQIRGVISKLPSEIVLDGSELEVGDIVRIEDLPEFEGIEYQEDSHLTVFTLSITRAAEADEDEELEEGEEGEEGEASEEADETDED